MAFDLVIRRLSSSTLNFLLGDHSLMVRDRLGSTAITTNGYGTFVAELRYYPWGTIRYSHGTTPTTYEFTGQRLEKEDGIITIPNHILTRAGNPTRSR